jgi:tRNA(fMet)-specific endonuclease VapC
VPYLFDTDAISEVLKRRPRAHYLRWLSTVPRTEQFCSAVSIGELYRGAFRAPNRDHHLANIDNRVLPAITVLSYDRATARVYGEIAATLEMQGRRLADADLQIAATALRHDLEVITGNLRHFERIPQLRLNRILATR